MPHRAFLSHSPADGRIARRLQNRLNAYRTPRSLVAIEGAQGPAPAKLRITAAHSRSSRGEQASEHIDLQECQALIVLCSPAAASDRQVNDDIDAFLALGRVWQIVPVIVDDGPDTDDVERDYFPPALCGRGLASVDLREAKRGGALAGDGREGGLLKLLAMLLGLEVTRIAQHERRRNDARVASLALTAAVFALTTIAAVVFGLVAERRVVTADAQRQVAALNAMQAAQLRSEALAAAEQQTAEQGQAAAEFQRARRALTGATRDLSTMVNLVLDEIGASHSASGANLQTLGAIEGTYWSLGEASSYFELRPNSIILTAEKISSTYKDIGRADDSARTIARLSRLNRNVARDHGASPSWRNGYAASLIALARQRLANGDNMGQANALLQAAQIYEDVCIVARPPQSALRQTPSDADARAGACVRFANLTLVRARAQDEAQQNVDLAALARSRMLVEAAIAAYPRNALVQTEGVRVRDQVARMLTRNETGHALSQPVQAQAND